MGGTVPERYATANVCQHEFIYPLYFFSSSPVNPQTSEDFSRLREKNVSRLFMDSLLFRSPSVRPFVVLSCRLVLLTFF